MTNVAFLICTFIVLIGFISAAGAVLWLDRAFFDGRIARWL